MAKHSIDRKTLRRDVIREKMLALVDLTNRNLKWVITGLTVLVVLVGLAFAYGWYQGRIASEQATAFYAAEKIIQNSTLPEKERKAAAIKGLTEFLDAYPDASLSPYAWMYLAQIQWADDKIEDAKQSFKMVLEHGSTTPFTRHLAMIGQAKLHEADKAYADSAAQYKNLPDKPFSDLKAYNLGRLAAAENRPEEAREQFKKVVNHFPPSRLAQWANLEHGSTTPFTRHLAMIGQAKLHEADKAYADSAAQYKNLPDKPFSDLKAYNLGRLAAAENRPEEAREQFKKVVNHFPPSRLAQWANEAMSFLP